jgi:hypothetical protein
VGWLSENEVMPHSFLQDHESDAPEWEPEALELPVMPLVIIDAWPHPLTPRTVEIDAPEDERGSHVIVIDLA